MGGKGKEGSAATRADRGDGGSGQRQAKESLADRLRSFSHRGQGRVRRPAGDQRPLRVLHLLSQRPGKTGSGIYLQSMVRHGAEAGFSQRVIVGIPADAAFPSIPPLSQSQIAPVLFGTSSLPFPVAGMSDVMPYESTRFSTFNSEMLSRYLNAFEAVIGREVRRFRPHVIHSHHLWLVTALARVLFPDLPILATCHGTELRQLRLSPHLAPFVVPSCSAIDRVMALHESHRQAIHEQYGIRMGKIIRVGAGYRDDIFCVPDRRPTGGKRELSVVYAGKLSRAKGLPWLIEAMNRIEAPPGRKVRLLIAGSGGGEEGSAVRQQAESCPARVTCLGPLPQEELARIFRSADVFVLPSFYEGLPLVVLEALACCCRIVVTDLPGIDAWLPAGLVDRGIVEKVPLPPMAGSDEPEPGGLDAFTANLAAAVSRQLERCACGEQDWYDEAATCIAPMRWDGIFKKVREIYHDVLS